MDALAKDVRYAIRMLRKNPGFTAVATLTLALGIGANTAIFSMVDYLLLRPLPVKDAAQITVLALRQKHGSLSTDFSVADYRDIRNQSGSVFSGVMGYQLSIDGLSVNGKADRVITYFVTGNFFSALGVQPHLGRLILPSEGGHFGADPVAVLGYSYWKTRFGADPRIAGRKVSVDGHPVTIVGVAPQGFYGIFPFTDAQVYLPLGMISIAGSPPDIMTSRSVRTLVVLGRLRPAATLRQAQAALGVISKRLSTQYPENDSDLNIQAFPERLTRPNPDPDNTIVVIAGLFLGLAVLVLLLACGNVANILLVRATVREREIAISAALGASRSGLIRQLLTESILLALAGGIAGILLGYWASATLSSIDVKTDLSVRFDFSFDWRVFTYAFSAALLTGLIVGIVPALRASRRNLNELLHDGGRSVTGGRHRFRNALVMAQVGGSLMVLIVAGLFTRSLAEAQQTNLGFDPSHVLNLTMDPNHIGYKDAQGIEFYGTLLDRVQALPGVESVSLANSVPLGYYNNGDTLEVDGFQTPSGERPPSAGYNIISHGYFRTLRIEIVRGRAFTDADNQKAPYVAIVNAAMAKRLWPDSDPIGRTFKMSGDLKHSIRVVGVVSDSRTNNVTGPIRPYFYLPYAQHYAGNSLATLQVRTTMAPERRRQEIERTIASLAPDLPVFDVKTMTQALYTLNGFLMFRIGAGLAAGLGILGLILSVVGVYGVISYAASRQTHEIGIRLALGALPRNILARVFRQAFFIVGIGLVLGVAAAYAAASVVDSFLVVSATDPLTYVTVSLILAAVALLACTIPARRAMRVDPMVALRHE